MAEPAPLVMLSEAKHLAGEREVRSTSDETSHAMPRSFAALRMTESRQGFGSYAFAVARKFSRGPQAAGRLLAFCRSVPYPAMVDMKMAHTGTDEK
jgi:hypothetical protein